MLLLLSCEDPEPHDSEVEPAITDSGAASDTAPADADGDGWIAAEDCNDQDEWVNPAEIEWCNGVDDDCDGEADEDALDRQSRHADADGDGYGGATVELVCEGTVLEGYVLNADDCDDADPDVHPGADEADCDGTIDLDCDGYVPADDADGDGTPNCDDCDPDDPDVHPDQDDGCDGIDNDCDGNTDENAEDCACVPEEYGGHAYLLCTDALEWLEAREYCRARGYDLVTIDDAAENTWLYDWAMPVGDGHCWLGFNDIADEGLWRWADGAFATFTAWHTENGSPNCGTACNCAALVDYWADETWTDYGCTSEYVFVCERGDGG